MLCLKLLMVAIQKSIEAISFRFKHLTFFGALWIYTVYIYICIYTLYPHVAVAVQRTIRTVGKVSDCICHGQTLGLACFNNATHRIFVKQTFFGSLFIPEQNPYHPWDWYISPHEMVDFIIYIYCIYIYVVYCIYM